MTKRLIVTASNLAYALAAVVPYRAGTFEGDLAAGALLSLCLGSAAYHWIQKDGDWAHRWDVGSMYAVGVTLLIVILAALGVPTRVPIVVGLTLIILLTTLPLDERTVSVVTAVFFVAAVVLLLVLVGIKALIPALLFGVAVAIRQAAKPEERKHGYLHAAWQVAVAVAVASAYWFSLTS